MTKEHVPPKRAFSDRSYLQYYVEQNEETELRQWRTREVTSSGISIFSLCQPCNNKTGRAYGQAYVDFVTSFIDVAWVKFRLRLYSSYMRFPALRFIQ
jgi:hypothetical protein